MVDSAIHKGESISLYCKGFSSGQVIFIRSVNVAHDLRTRITVGRYWRTLLPVKKAPDLRARITLGGRRRIHTHHVRWAKLHSLDDRLLHPCLQVIVKDKRIANFARRECAFFVQSTHILPDRTHKFGAILWNVISEHFCRFFQWKPSRPYWNDEKYAKLPTTCY